MLLLFIFNNFGLIGNIYHRIIFFELFIVFIFMFFVQVSYKIISFSQWIITTTIIFIDITFVIYLMSKICWRFMKTIFYYIIYSIPFWYFPRVDCISNGFFSCNQTIWCFNYLFLRWIRCWYSVKLDKLSPCLDK